MAVFDGNERSKTILDDTQTLTCIIGAAQNVQGHTVYDIKVQRGTSPENSWNVKRRYSDFDALNNLLLCSSIDLPLPPKKMFGKLEREFIAERQQGLQSYLNFILSHPFLSSSVHVKKFLDPEKYSFNFVEISLQHVSMIFRSEPQWEIVEPLLDFGWRIRKQYFFIKSKNEPKKKYILSWMDNGPEKYLNHKDLLVAIKLLGSIQHPYIYPITMCSASVNGVSVIYDYLENGTIRDILCKAKPQAPFLKKYGNPKSYNVFELAKIRTYSLHILLALKFLHDKGFYHGNIHAGNATIVDNKCKLLDIFNGILGVSCYLRPYYLTVKKIQRLEDVDVYCFGHFLYEMTFGIPLFATSCDNIPNSCSAELRSVFEAILSKESLKNGLPSVTELLQHKFYASALCETEKYHFKVPSQLKESLKCAKLMAEERLRMEQRAVRHTKRLSKVQAQLTDEQRKKRSSEHKRKNTSDLTNSASSERSQSSTPNAENLVTSPNAPSSSQLSIGSSVDLPGCPPPPPPPPVPAPVTSPSSDRSLLLNSIQGFNKGALKKAETKDCSAPKI